MIGSNYFDDQHVLCDDLNNTESSKNQELVRRTLALIHNGNLGSGSVVGEYGSTSLQVTKDAAAQITIAAGAAIDNQGEYTSIASPWTIAKASLPANVEWSSAGSAVFYIKINHITTSGSYRQDDLGNSYPTRYTDDYALQISSAAASGSQVLLASFTADPTGEISGDITDARIFIRARAYDDATYLGNSPIVGHTRVSDHIHAKGSGTQSTTNPHGMTLSDLGFTDESTVNHWRDAHVNGIMLLANDASTLNSWSGSVISPASAAYISFTSPSAYAFMNVNGTLFSGSLANLTGTDAPSDGTFWVVADGTTTPKFLPTGSYAFGVSNPHGQPLYVRLGLATVADSGDDITSWVNMRHVFAMSQYEVRADTTEGVSDPAGSLLERASIVDNLNRIRYQLGKIIDGDENNWDTTPSIALSNQVIVLYCAADISSGSAESSVDATTYPQWDYSAGMGSPYYTLIAKGKFIYKSGMSDLVLRCKIMEDAGGTAKADLWLDSASGSVEATTATYEQVVTSLALSALTNNTVHDWKVSISLTAGSVARMTEPLVTIETYSP